MTASELLMSFQSDVLDVPVMRPTVSETTSLGAAYAAGLAVGFWRDLDELRAQWRVDREWRSTMAADERARGRPDVGEGRGRAMDWIDED